MKTTGESPSEGEACNALNLKATASPQGEVGSSRKGKTSPKPSYQ